MLVELDDVLELVEEIRWLWKPSKFPEVNSAMDDLKEELLKYKEIPTSDEKIAGR